jgi:hypothetical protein
MAGNTSVGTLERMSMMDEDVYQLLKEIANYKLERSFVNFIFRAQELVKKENAERIQAEGLSRMPTSTSLDKERAAYEEPKS